MTRKKEKFKPLNKNLITFYSCGQTVYEKVHVGNAKTYVAWDVLYRTLRHFGYNVLHVQNFTDVGHLTDDADTGEDKIVKRARERKEHPMQLVDREIEEYHQVMDMINVHRPDIAPRATGHIPEMIDLVLSLEEKDYAYNIDNSLYFDTSKFEDYGKLARLNLENQQVGVRDEVKIIEGKKNPSDFALWIKAPAEHIMQYHSPWGKGYPGWHLECSVMAMKYLGDTIDIHSGGVDHIPIHHTNEIAQSEAATGQKFANYWMHSEFITLNGEKMSKSTGNFITLRELIEEVGPSAARYALTQANYRTQADFSMDKAKAAKTTFERQLRIYHLSLQQLVLQNIDLNNAEVDEELMVSFDGAMADDLNTPLAFSILADLTKTMDQQIQDGVHEALPSLVITFEIMMEVLGIPYTKLDPVEIQQVQSMVEHRLSLRAEKKYKESDAIRDFLNSNGYLLNDVSKEKTEWFRP